MTNKREHKNKLKAIFAVKLGRTVKDVSEEYQVSSSTLRKWVAAYQPSDPKTVKALLLESIVGLLTAGDVQGSAISGIVNGLKFCLDDTTGMTLEEVMKLADQGDEVQLDFDNLPDPPDDLTALSMDGLE